MLFLVNYFTAVQPQVLGASTSKHSGFSIMGFFSGITSFFHLGTNSSSNSSNSYNSNTSTPALSSAQTTLSEAQLLALAGDPYKNGNLPLGDNKYTTNGAKKGYIYLCHAQKGQGGAQSDGPWIHGSTWNIKEKSSIAGHVSWSGAVFSSSVSSTTRTLSGNDLPINHTTGVFPVSTSDPAYKYDKNPNTISSQTFTQSFPVTPEYSDTSTCIGGEVGVMLTGVALFNGFDAELRDAVAHEVQDGCQGHPQEKGEYHYHGLSSCIKDVSETTVIGFALDGFPITGPKVSENKYLVTDNLDECHGITSEIMLDGKKTVIYHYVMTQDFPYSVSCFRGKPVSYQVVASGQMGSMPSGIIQQHGQNNQVGMMGSPTDTQAGASGTMRTPPQEAFTACSGKTSGSSCSFTNPMGTITGTCSIPPQQSALVCVPTSGMHP